MTRWFWALLLVSVVFAVLVTMALPFGPDLIYAVQAGSLLGMVFLLGRRA